VAGDGGSADVEPWGNVRVAGHSSLVFGGILTSPGPEGGARWRRRS
jgi:hypothetical protein